MEIISYVYQSKDTAKGSKGKNIIRCDFVNVGENSNRARQTEGKQGKISQNEKTR